MTQTILTLTTCLMNSYLNMKRNRVKLARGALRSKLSLLKLFIGQRVKLPENSVQSVVTTLQMGKALRYCLASMAIIKIVLICGSIVKKDAQFVM